jgi:hypothetical protein
MKYLGYLALLLFAGRAHAQFTLFSQNALHLGWGKDPYYTNKNNYLTTCVISIGTCTGTANTPDVAIIQEVMNGNEVATLYATPGTYQVYVSELQGHSSYVEAYSFLVRAVTTTNTCCSITRTTGNSVLVKYTGGGFSRPPIGLVVAQAGKESWVIDYHAVFGKVPARRTEVSNIGSAILAFQATQMDATTPHAVKAFVVGGDWNFPHDDPAFGAIQSKVGVPILIAPTGLTSLKPGGTGLSSAYDHFVWAPSLVTGTTPKIWDPPPGGVTLPQFRNGFSDHLGISISVQIQ